MRALFGAVALVAIALSVVLSGAASASPPGKPSPIKNCPSNPTGYVADNNVGAHYTGTAPVTYYFDSLVDESPANGVPGLIGYCVYTDGTVSEATATYNEHGQWKSDFSGGNLSFVRPHGEKSNIPLDGTTDIEVGTAMFNPAPGTQSILLHISDAGVCQDLYGGDATTCFVLPKPGPVCNAGAGNTDAAYNAIPFDVEHCSPPSEAFEAQQTNEFGDEVTLDTTAGSELKSMTVDFQSYGCGVSGHWYTGDCVTTGQTFTVPGGITANIYDPGNLLAPIASSTIYPNIPDRPSADNVNCTGADAGKWFDSVFGQCNYSLSVPLTFTFPAGTTFSDGDAVVWTVEFDTTHYGYSPIGEGAPCYSPDPGCGYDSLNVGTMSYPNAPYAGTDVNEDVAFRSYGGVNGPPLVPLASETGWTGYRPLGEIVLGS